MTIAKLFAFLAELYKPKLKVFFKKLISSNIITGLNLDKLSRITWGYAST